MPDGDQFHRGAQWARGGLVEQASGWLSEHLGDFEGQR
jgi:hypothetical protein